MTPEDLEQIRAVVREETTAAIQEHDTIGSIRDMTVERDRSQAKALSARVAKLEAQVRRIEMQNP